MMKPIRVTIGMWVAFSFAHAFLLWSVSSILLPALSQARTLPPPPPPAPYMRVLILALLILGGVLFFGTPAFGYLWSRLHVRWYNARLPTAPTCQNCGYNLTGNVSGVCPECGTEIGKP